MASQNQKLSSPTKCSHCGNVAPMSIPAAYSDIANHEDKSAGYSWEESDNYELLVCPACQKVTLRRYYWNDIMYSKDVPFSILYPQSTRIPLALPAEIQKAY